MHKLKIYPNATRATGLAVLLTASQSWALDYDEAVDGDLSDDPANPTVLAVESGANPITGEAADAPLDRDIFTLNIPEGFEATAFELTAFELVTNPADGGMLVALEPGPIISDLTSQDALRGFVIAGVDAGTQAGDDLLDDLGGGSLEAGQWTVWVQNTGAVTRYTLTAKLSPLFEINPGLNGSWFNPDTNFQGFLFDVFPDQGVMSVAWFTYATDPPSSLVTDELGDSSQRWMIAIGPYSGNTANLDITQFSGGLFDSGLPEPTQTPDGTMTIEFADCNNGLVSYSIDSINQSGVIPITRIATDNVPLCEALIGLDE